MRFLALAMMLAALSGCKEEYDLDEYKMLKNSGELEDVVHEWMHEYIEKYCRVSARGEIECE